MCRRALLETFGDVNAAANFLSSSSFK